MSDADPITQKNRLTLGKNLLLNAYWFGLSFMWNSLHVIILPAVLLFMVPEEQKNTYLGILTFFGLMIAIVIQPISGAISDRWASKWGRRRPLILFGTLFDFVFLACLGWAGGLWWMLVGYIGLQFSSNIAHGPMQGLIPDIAPARQFGWASGFKNFMDMAGLVAAVLLMGNLVSADTRQPLAAIGIVMILLAVTAALTLTGVKEEPSMALQQKREPLGELARTALFDIFRIDWKAHRSYIWFLIGRLFFLSGVTGVQAFAQYFVRDVLVDIPNPIQTTGNLLAVIAVAVVIFALVGGRLGDRYGHRLVCLIASFISAVGIVLLIWVRTPATLLAFGSVLGVGTGLYLTANWALATQMARGKEAGKLLGLTNLATAGSQAIGRLEGPGIDLLNNAWPGEWMGYTGLFILGAFATLFGVVFLLKLPAQFASESKTAPPIIQ